MPQAQGLTLNTDGYFSLNGKRYAFIAREIYVAIGIFYHYIRDLTTAVVSHGLTTGEIFLGPGSDKTISKI